METHGEKTSASFKDLFRDLVRSQAKEKVSLASEGLYETHSPEVNRRHIQERIDLIMKFSQENEVLILLRDVAASEVGARAILATIVSRDE